MKRLLFSFLIILYFLNNIGAQDLENCNSLFDSTDYIRLTIILPFDSLYSGGYNENKKYSANINYSTRSSSVSSMHITISKRGNFRKRIENCSFPPLSLHFEANRAKGTLFEGIKKIKLVTHCQNNDTLFDQYILQEYYAYRIYNLLTERSYKTKLARCTYIDSKNSYPNIVRWGILLENQKDLANRVNGEILDFKYITPKAVKPYYYSLMQLFQTMIINQDWNLGLGHNVDLVGIYPDMQPVTIPYDFDMSGIIQIPYNSPSVAFKQGEKPLRKYPKKNGNSKEYKKALNKCIIEKNNILNLFQNDTCLTKDIRDKMIGSINEFYFYIEK
jgi:hypothetical protein